jgi:Ricin-type beta-trefoil lectin domain-like
MLVNDKSARCLDQDYSDNTQHRDVLAWPCNVGALNQRWRKVQVTGDWFHLVNVRSGKCLNQDYSNNTEHSNVIAYTCDAGSFLNDVWYSYYDTGKGKWAIGNLQSNKCLDQDYSGGTMHTNILAYKCQPNSQLQTTISNQLWWFDSI